MPERPQRYLGNEGAAKVVHACDAEWGRAMADLGVWTGVDGDAPRRVGRSGVDLEKDLEDWIAADATSRRSATRAGSQDRRSASLARWRSARSAGPRCAGPLGGDGDQARATLPQSARSRRRSTTWRVVDRGPRWRRIGVEAPARTLSKFGDGEAAARAVREQLDAEAEGHAAPRGCAARRAVGVGSPGLSASPTTSSRLRDPNQRRELRGVRAGRRSLGLLVREVEEQRRSDARQVPQPKRTVAAVRGQRAVKAGVVAQFDSDRFVRMAEEAGLHVQLTGYVLSVPFVKAGGCAPAHRRSDSAVRDPT